MSNKIIELFMKYVAYPLANVFVGKLLVIIKDWLASVKLKKEIQSEIKKLKASKTDEEIIDHLRNLNL